MSRETDTSPLRTPEGDWIGREELQELLADAGYAAGQREQFLMSVLTELSSEDPEAPKSESREALIAEVRSILSDEQGKWNRSPISDETL